MAPISGSASAPASLPATQPDPKVILALYAATGDYQDLWPRVGRVYGGAFGRIVTAGHSYRVFGATACTQPADLPAAEAVLCHEFVHVWLYQSRGLPNDGNWLTEGIANAAQLTVFPESGDRAGFAALLQQGRMVPLKRLLDQQRIERKDYWQAATLIETIVETYPGRLDKLIDNYPSVAGSARLISENLGVNLPALAKAWEKHVLSAASQPVSRATKL